MPLLSASLHHFVNSDQTYLSTNTVFFFFFLTKQGQLNRNLGRKKGRTHQQRGSQQNLSSSIRQHRRHMKCNITLTITYLIFINSIDIFFLLLIIITSCKSCLSLHFPFFHCFCYNCLAKEKSKGMWEQFKAARSSSSPNFLNSSPATMEARVPSICLQFPKP